MGYPETVNAVTPKQYEEYLERVEAEQPTELNLVEVILAPNLFDLEHKNFGKLNPEE